jgi:predicted GNAT family acetyltransferase
MALAALRSAAAKPPRLALPRFAMSAAAAAASSSAAKSAPAVVHEAARSRFAVKHEAGDAVLEYRVSLQSGGSLRPRARGSRARAGDAQTSEAQGTRTMDMYRTYVPNQFRGQGVAGLLATAAFEFAKREKYQVIPTCSYISDTFLPKNPQWQELVRKPSQL